MCLFSLASFIFSLLVGYPHNQEIEQISEASHSNYVIEEILTQTDANSIELSCL